MLLGVRGRMCYKQIGIYAYRVVQTMNRYRNLSSRSRSIFWVVLAAMIVVGLIAFFTSETGRNVALLCCGAVILLIVAGLVSEGGMRRPR